MKKVLGLIVFAYCFVLYVSGITDVHSAEVKERFYGIIVVNGDITTLEHPDAWSTYPTDVNDSNVIAGWYDTPDREYGFTYGGNSFTTIDVPGSVACKVEGINNTGDVVGWYTDEDGVRHGFIHRFSDKRFIDVNYAGTAYSLTDINDNWDIVGWNATSYGVSGVIYSSYPISSPESYKYPGSSDTTVTSVNNQGDIAGYYQVEEEDGTIQYGYMRLSGSDTAVNITFNSDSAADLTGVGGISNNGTVVGWYEQGGKRYGYIYNGTSYESVAKSGENNTSLTGISNSEVAVGVVSRFEVSDDDSTCFINSLSVTR